MQAFGLARIGRDAELKYLEDGTVVLNVSLAFSHGRKGDDGKRPTEWVDGSLFGKRAEALAQYLTKGTACAVTLDDVHIQEFKKRDGTPGSKIVGKISAIDLAGGGQGRAPAPSAPPAPAPKPQAQSVAFEGMDNDIPF